MRIKPNHRKVVLQRIEKLLTDSHPPLKRLVRIGRAQAHDVVRDGNDAGIIEVRRVDIGDGCTGRTDRRRTIENPPVLMASSILP